MRVSKDPMEPLRCWKELFFGERGGSRPKKVSRLRRRSSGNILSATHAAVGE